MHEAVDNLDNAKMRTKIVTQEFIVIAGQIDDPRALAALAQDLLHDVIVRLRPVPRPLQAPAVDDIADEINRLCVMDAEEIE